MSNFGMHVIVKFSDATYGKMEQNFNNVTEIHYGYPSVLGKRIAIESDIHDTGAVYSIGDITEFVITTEIEKKHSF